jgi:hypothetical protein
VERGRQVSAAAAGVLHRRGGRAVVPASVGVVGGVPNQQPTRCSRLMNLSESAPIRPKRQSQAWCADDCCLVIVEVSSGVIDGCVDPARKASREMRRMTIRAGADRGGGRRRNGPPPPPPWPWRKPARPWRKPARPSSAAGRRAAGVWAFSHARSPAGRRCRCRLHPFPAGSAGPLGQRPLPPRPAPDPSASPAHEPQEIGSAPWTAAPASATVAVAVARSAGGHPLGLPRRGWSSFALAAGLPGRVDAAVSITPDETSPITKDQSRWRHVRWSPGFLLSFSERVRSDECFATDPRVRTTPR